MIEDATPNIKVLVEPVKVTSNKAKELIEKHRPTDKENITGRFYECKETLKLLNRTYEATFGEQPSLESPMYLQWSMFKKKLIQGLENNFLLWETTIRNQYEQNPHWKFTSKLPKKQYDTWGYEKN